jgi:hypothetical protein
MGAGIRELPFESLQETANGKIAKSLSSKRLGVKLLFPSDHDLMGTPNFFRIDPGVTPGVIGDIAVGAGGTGAESSPLSIRS